jgi:hypothetical protein
MPKIDDMIPTKTNYLRKEDVGEAGVDLGIKSFHTEDVGNDGEKESKLVMSFTNPAYKGMIVNKENGSRLKITLKTDDTDLMIGRVINVYSDPFVAFGGKTVGGLRIRPARTTEARPTQTVRVKPAPVVEDDGPPSPPVEVYNDDIPF